MSSTSARPHCPSRHRSRGPASFCSAFRRARFSREKARTVGQGRSLSRGDARACRVPSLADAKRGEGRTRSPYTPRSRDTACPPGTAGSSPSAVLAPHPQPPIARSLCSEADPPVYTQRAAHADRLRAAHQHHHRTGVAAPSHGQSYAALGPGGAGRPPPGRGSSSPAGNDSDRTTEVTPTLAK